MSSAARTTRLADVTSQPDSAPAPRTRPRNRRDLIVRAAIGLFYRTGYADVSMSEIAGAVGVQPSALYRHFPSKSSLFLAAARASLTPTADALLDLGTQPRDATLHQLARVTLAHREAGVLWQREARLLPAEIRDEVRTELRRVARQLTEHLAADRTELSPDQADLLAWAALAAMSSISFHQLQLPENDFEALIYDILDRITATRLPEASIAGTVAIPAPGLSPRTRREQLLRQASRLFATSGYSAVTIDDIGKAAGIAGPSIYNHFESKQDLLIAALDRSNEWLWMELDDALATARTEADALGSLLDSYLRLATRRPDLVNFLVSDLRQLPESYRHRARQSQHDYITEWSHLVGAIRPDLDPTAARIQVQAAIMIITNCVQTPHLTRLPDLTTALRSVAISLLQCS